MKVKKQQAPKKEEKRQVKFECSKEFYLRIMDEKLQRNLTIQQLAIRALELYFGTPEYFHRDIEAIAKSLDSSVGQISRDALQEGILALLRAMPSDARAAALRKTTIGLAADYEVASQFSPRIVFHGGTLNEKKAKEIALVAHIQAIVDFLFQLPTEKVRLVRESLTLDLKYYRSARIKPLGTEKPYPAGNTRDTEGEN